MNEYVGMRLAAEMFDDVQRFRISAENKVRSSSIDPDAMRLDQAISTYLDTEKAIEKELAREFKRVVPQSIKDWQETERGIGLHLLARLLGQTGDPYIAHPYRHEGEGAKRHLVELEPYPRYVTNLWAYCGHGDAALKLRKGMTAEEALAAGSPKAKMLTHLLAESAVKQGIRSVCDDGQIYKPFSKAEIASGSPNGVCQLCDLKKADHASKSISRYGQTYLDARHKYEDHIHNDSCVRCGPSGKPALKGSPVSKSHQNGMAIRCLGKEILKDLWLAAKEAHDES